MVRRQDIIFLMLKETKCKIINQNIFIDKICLKLIYSNMSGREFTPMMKYKHCFINKMFEMLHRKERSQDTYEICNICYLYGVMNDIFSFRMRTLVKLSREK